MARQRERKSDDGEPVMSVNGDSSDSVRGVGGEEEGSVDSEGAESVAGEEEESVDSEGVGSVGSEEEESVDGEEGGSGDDGKEGATENTQQAIEVNIT